MAGAIPICLRPAEGEMIRSLNDVRLSVLLRVLDEHDWMAARKLLPALAEQEQAERQTKRQQFENEEGTQ